MTSSPVGGASRARHAATGAAESPPRRYWLGLRRDVDTPEDLQAVLALGAAPAKPRRSPASCCSDVVERLDAHHRAGQCSGNALDRLNLRRYQLAKLVHFSALARTMTYTARRTSACETRRSPRSAVPRRRLCRPPSGRGCMPAPWRPPGTAYDCRPELVTVQQWSRPVSSWSVVFSLIVRFLRCARLARAAARAVARTFAPSWTGPGAVRPACGEAPWLGSVARFGQPWRARCGRRRDRW